MRLFLALITLSQVYLLGANTTVIYQPGAPSTGPFPSNVLSVIDHSQKTGLRVSLPLPAGCTVLSTDSGCVNLLLLNQFDGFSVNAGATVCFSDVVDTTTLAAGIRFVPADSKDPATPVDRIVYDPDTNCAYAKPAQILRQDTRYILAITSAVIDAGGKRLKSSDEFKDCLKNTSLQACADLSKAMDQAGLSGNDNKPGDVIGATLFTTQSATTWLEKAHAQIASGAIPGAGALLGPMASFDLQNDVQSVTWIPQSGIAGLDYSQSLPMGILPGVQKIAFGAFLSPLYLNIAGPEAGSISTAPTTLSPAPTLVQPVSFHVLLPPASATGNGKIPVIIFGHGLSDSQFGASTFAAASWAQKGFATLAIEIQGHGFGPGGVTQVNARSGVYTIPTPGRGVQFSTGAPIGPEDGCIAPGALATRDCGRQTAADLFALVRALQTSGGLGLNLDTSRIYYAGQSFGAIYGAMFTAVEPGIMASALNSGGGTQADVARLSPIARQLGAAYLNSFSPSLLNAAIAGEQPYFHDTFNDSYAYRGQVVTRPVPGAIPILKAFEQAEWLGMPGDPLSYAPHLQQSDLLTGASARPVLLQFGLGDLEVPNPTELALMRAGSLQRSTWVLRTERMAALDPRTLGLLDPTVPYPIYPHRFLSNPTMFDPAAPGPLKAVGIAAQQQIADFFRTGGLVVPDPNGYLTGAYTGQRLFENPTVVPVPDGLNFLQIQP